ncbi:MAG: sigma-70 family RNA polymerase sigma factor [Acidimicrobiales bacterium]
MSDPQRAESYEDFYHRELPALVALAAAVTGSHLAAEDLAQEALVRAYRRWDQLSLYDKPGAWARRVTINLALSSRKRAANEVRARLRLRSEPTMSAAPVHYQYLWDAVRKLPGKQRAAVALHYLEDRPVAEIAEILECAESTAKVHLHRGRTALAALLQTGQPGHQQPDHQRPGHQHPGPAPDHDQSGGVR